MTKTSLAMRARNAQNPFTEVTRVSEFDSFGPFGPEGSKGRWVSAISFFDLSFGSYCGWIIIRIHPMHASTLTAVLKIIRLATHACCTGHLAWHVHFWGSVSEKMKVAI